MTMKL